MYEVLVVVLAVVAHSTPGNAVLGAVKGPLWSWSLVEPPYTLVGAFQMNVVLGLVVGAPAAFGACAWEERRSGE